MQAHSARRCNRASSPARRATLRGQLRVRRVDEGLEPRSEAAQQSAVAKGWRWTGELEEIASAFETQGLPRGFHEAAAEIFRRPPGRN